MPDEYGPWIEHDGLGCPLSSGTQVKIQHEDAHGYQTIYSATIIRDLDHPDWDHRNFRRVMNWRGLTGLAGRVLAYSIRKPRGLLILQEIAANPSAAPIEERRPERVLA